MLPPGEGIKTRAKKSGCAPQEPEAGLEPLALGLLEDPTQSPEARAEAYLNPEQGFEDVKAVLDGARQILDEVIAEGSEEQKAEAGALLERIG